MLKSVCKNFFNKNKCVAVLGSQQGDEGKGKLVDLLAKEYDIVARFNGGANAGHTLNIDNNKFALHLLPCGMLCKDTLNVIGNGVVVDLPVLTNELDELKKFGIHNEKNLRISDRAHLLFGFHKMIDAFQERQRKSNNNGQILGTTLRGIGPCYATKALRLGIRVGELVHDFKTFREKYFNFVRTIEHMYDLNYNDKTTSDELSFLSDIRNRIKPMVCDTITLLNKAKKNNKTILAEGANACLLDLDFGTYPYVTSSSTSVAGVFSGLGISPSSLDSVIGVVKAYTTRVGSGPFPSEEKGEIGEYLKNEGQEYGSTTGRDRRCGQLDIPQLRYSTQINGYNYINLTKLDVLSKLKNIKIGVEYIKTDFEKSDSKQVLNFGEMPSTLEDYMNCSLKYETLPGQQSDISKIRKYEDLPENARRYIERVEELIGVKICWIGVGPERNDMITIY